MPFYFVGYYDIYCAERALRRAHVVWGGVALSVMATHRYMNTADHM
jgi:hypothetical protein